MTGKELSEVVAEAAARTERAAALQREAIARQEVATAKLEELEARREGEGNWMKEAAERQEKMLQDYHRRTDEIVAELRDQRDERRALLEALFRVMDWLPPPPPDLGPA